MQPAPLYYPIQRDLDKIQLDVSNILAQEELGNRRRKVYYRERLSRINTDMLFGLPGTAGQDWILISPNPKTMDISRDQSVDGIGLIEIGDIEMLVDRLVVPRETLTQAEFYVADNPDADPPLFNDKANYNIVNRSVLEGGKGTRGLYKSFWVCYLRRAQTAPNANVKFNTIQQ